MPKEVAMDSNVSIEGIRAQLPPNRHSTPKEELWRILLEFMQSSRKGVSLASSENKIRAISDEHSADGGEQVACPNCAAVFPAEEPRCPYCGKLNPAGAEQAYMDELADIKEDTSDLAEDAQDTFTADLQRNTKRTIIIVVVVLAIIATLFLAVTCMDKHEERQSIQAYQARETFRAQYFAEFDRLYEAGDDDALSAYVWSLMDNPGFEAMYSWTHTDYLEVHDDWEALRAAEDDIAAGTCGIDDYTWLVSVALRLAQLDTGNASSTAALSAEEEERAADYRAYAWQFLQDTLQMDKEAIAAFAEDAKDADGFVQTAKLKQNLEVRLRQLGTLG